MTGFSSQLTLDGVNYLWESNYRQFEPSAIVQERGPIKNQKALKTHYRIVAAALAVGLSTAIASANSITVTQSSAVNVPGGSTWVYDLSFVNSTLNNGDFVTINDFGLGVSSILPAGWVFSQSLTGPNSLPANDDPNLLNATFTWQGGNGTVVSPNPSTVVDQVVTLTTTIPVGSLDNSDYTTIDHVTSGIVAGTSSRVIGSVRTPNAKPTTVPDGGSSLALFGLAITAIQCARRKLSR